MPEPSRQFAELAQAFRDPEHPGFWIPSAEGGWITPSEEDWGKAPPPQPSKTASTRSKASRT